MKEREGFNTKVITEFRASGGKVAIFGDQPMVILHTTLARTGEVREIPLAVGVEGDELLVFANDGGAPVHPAWYFNLKAHPRIPASPSRWERSVFGRRPTSVGGPARNG